MYEKKIPEVLHCGISIAIKVLGGKWKAWIIDCINRGIKRPSELHRKISMASPRVINMQLKELEDLGIIYKKVYAEVPLRVEYYLTETGNSVLPIIDAMEKWGDEKRDQIVPEGGESRMETCDMTVQAI